MSPTTLPTPPAAYQIRSAVAFCCLALALIADGQAPQYSVTDLGTLGGTGSYGYGINATGLVVGIATLNGDSADRAFIFDGTMHDLGTLGGTHSYASGVNGNGKVSGYSYTVGALLGTRHAYLYDGTMHDLGTLGGAESLAGRLNDSDCVVGDSDTAGNSAHHAFMYDGTMHDLGTLGGTYSEAVSINATNAITGSSRIGDNIHYHAFLYDSSMHDLGTLGGTDSRGYGINDNGYVVGANNGVGLWRAFLYDGTMHALGTLGGSSEYAFGINIKNEVVGQSDFGVPPDRHRAFYWSSTTGMVDLNSLIDAQSGWELESAQQINQAGQITGWGLIAGQEHAFLLTPTRRIDVTQHFETERLTVQALYRATHSTITDANLSGGAGTQLNAIGTGQYVTYTVPVTDAGTYKLKVAAKTGPKRGIFKLSVGGVAQGKAQDEYTASIGYSVRDLGTVTFFSGGNKAFKFLVSGKNAKSAGYSIALDYIELVPINRLETESLKVQAITPPPSGVSPFQWSGIFNATAASGGAGTYFNANSVGNYITYTLPVAKAGTYHVRVGIQTKPEKGKFQLAINGLNIGQPQDEYYPSITYGVRDLGAATFPVAGNYAFKFTVAGKNASSTGYTLAFDYIELIP